MFAFVYSEETIREHGVLSVKRYGNKYKITWLKSVRKKGYEKINKKKQDEDDTWYITTPFDGSVCEVCDSFEDLDDKKKLDCNISRAKSIIFEYAFCNEWDYFVTLTIDKEKYDRYDLDAYKKDLGKWINNYNTHHGSKISYLLIPEMHKDGAWHMHGLFKGVLDKHLIINKNGYLDFPLYAKKFGFCSLSPLKSHEAISKYITKYVSKDMSVRRYGQRLYYCSHGLNRAEKIMEFTGVLPDSFDWQFEHPDGFCKSFMASDLECLDNLSYR